MCPFWSGQVRACPLTVYVISDLNLCAPSWASAGWVTCVWSGLAGLFWEVIEEEYERSISMLPQPLWFGWLSYFLQPYKFRLQHNTYSKPFYNACCHRGEIQSPCSYSVTMVSCCIPHSRIGPHCEKLVTSYCTCSAKVLYKTPWTKSLPELQICKQDSV